MWLAAPAVTNWGAVMCGAIAWGTTLVLNVPGTLVSPAWLVSVAVKLMAPTGPALNWIELVLPSTESTPEPPPALTITPESRVQK